MKNRISICISKALRKFESTRFVFHISCFLFFSLFFIPSTYAVPSTITFRHEHHLFTLRPTQYPEWQSLQDQWFYEGKEVHVPRTLRVDGDNLPPIPEGFERRAVIAWDSDAIRATLQEHIARPFNRDAGSVRISRSSSGAIVFDGVGMTGREVDLDATVSLTIAALQQNITDVVLPVEVEAPTIVVEDKTLREQGITEVVTVGESDYSNSPAARRHNITTGLSKFNGHLIPQGAEFSFNEVLGPVDASTGYKRELVIKGDKTVPDYGGGLCQISSTAYRGVWEYGLPILQRKNHSFAVNHYSPQGTDATIYPPNVDLRFLNNTPAALLIQTYEQDDKAYYIFYGTRDTRETEIYGPYVWDYRAPPPPKTEKTTDIPPGTTRKVGSEVAGMKTQWFRRVVSDDGTEKIESVYSYYEARPLFYQVGVEASELLQLEEESLLSDLNSVDS